MKVEIKRINKAYHFEGRTESNQIVQIDAAPSIGGEEKGARPMDLILLGIGGCASIDLGIILRKQKQFVEDYAVEVVGDRKDSVSKEFEHVHLHFKLKGKFKKALLEKAIDLTLNKYCSAIKSLSEGVKITHNYTISDEE